MHIMAASPPVFRDKEAMRVWCTAARSGGKTTLALVPTMGYLHDGHLSLVAAAREAGAHAVVVSIYVNPTQFAPGEDLDTYPRDPQGDHAKLASVGVDAVFEPQDLYAPQGEPPHETYVTVENLQRGLCGKSRPTHFRGVATVVSKLFNIVRPDIAVFGRKDYQQFMLLNRMVRDLDFGIRMIGAPLVREADGLALSSRNVRLTPDNRIKALSISAALRAAAQEAKSGAVTDSGAARDKIVQAITQAGGVVDYVEIVAQSTLTEVPTLGVVPSVILVAAKFGSVRLLDNWEL